jgi:long-subunit fatty acid transport protein
MRMSTMLSRGGLLALAGVVLMTTPALAGGYDTPILYSARHLGMGGTAIGYVNDASAPFHNPAGISHTPGFSLLVDAGLLMGTLKGNPFSNLRPTDSRDSIEAEPIMAPPFMLGLSARPFKTLMGDNDFLAIGLGAYPVASGKAVYHYESMTGTTQQDITDLMFLEVSPVISLHIPESLKGPGLHHLSLAVGYRFTYASLKRSQGNLGDPHILDASVTAFDMTGFRLGLQYAPIPEFSLGIVYRNRLTMALEGEGGTATMQELVSASTELTLPSKLGVGFRVNGGPVSLAADVEYSFQSENEGKPLVGRVAGDDSDTELTNIAQWQDAITARVGLEGRFLDGWAVRAGYIFDEQAGNRKYATAFGTPPAPTHSATAGFGYDAGDWAINVAYAYRTGSIDITEGDVLVGTQSQKPYENPDGEPLAEYCAACGMPGEYSIELHGIYVDFSYDLPF